MDGHSGGVAAPIVGVAVPEGHQGSVAALVAGGEAVGVVAAGVAGLSVGFAIWQSLSDNSVFLSIPPPDCVSEDCFNGRFLRSTESKVTAASSLSFVRGCG